MQSCAGQTSPLAMQITHGCGLHWPASPPPESRLLFRPPAWPTSLPSRLWAAQMPPSGRLHAVLSRACGAIWYCMAGGSFQPLSRSCKPSWSGCLILLHMARLPWRPSSWSLPYWREVTSSSPRQPPLSQARSQGRERARQASNPQFRFFFGLRQSGKLVVSMALCFASGHAVLYALWPGDAESSRITLCSCH